MSTDKVTPHEAYDGLYEVEGWSFDLEEEGDLEYIDRAIRAWTAWREFVAQQHATGGQEPLF